MVAIFDYNPRESSPNTDIEAELTFSAGDVISVLGDMDDDGFFHGQLNGNVGLVPSNFLQILPAEAPPPAAQPAPEPKRDPQVPLLSPVAPQMGSTCAVELEDPEPGDPEAGDPHSGHPGPGDAEPGDRGPEDPESVDPHPGHPEPGDPDPGDPGPGDPGPADPGPGEPHSRDPASDSLCEPVVDLPPLPDAGRSEAQTDCSPPGKKKRSFFSKGRRLFKRLGSGKKD